MDKSMYNPLPYVVVTMLLMLAIRASEIGRVCRKTEDPGLCTRLLGSDSRASSAGLPELEQITIDLAYNSAQGTKTKIQSLLHSAKDPQVRDCLAACYESYAGALGSLSKAAEYLRSGDYNGLALDGGSVYEEANDCESAFKRKPPSPLTNENRALGCFGDIISVIAGLLPAR